MGQPTAVAAASSVATPVAAREGRGGRATGATATTAATFKPRRRLAVGRGRSADQLTVAEPPLARPGPAAPSQQPQT